MGKFFMDEKIKRNLLQIQEQIAPYTPKIIAVTKYFGVDAIIFGYDAGLRNFGESRAVEAIEKIKSLPDGIRENSKFHFIGHLQTNKVNKVVCNFDVIHSVDSLKLAKAISEEAVKIGKVQDVFIQLNNANEEQKYGFSKQELFDNFEQIRSLEGLNILGLMNIAPLEAENNELENLFEDVRTTQIELVKKYNCEMKEISMGMSNDYQIAAKHGATMLRIGRKLFSTT
ncbi:YggS family pyridoxal phosphate-dependent enzyme [bacterium]|nr:YggS family pyridoxal phosphate-dependent enzyme [bacterium]